MDGGDGGGGGILHAAVINHFSVSKSKLEFALSTDQVVLERRPCLKNKIDKKQILKGGGGGARPGLL